MIKDKTVTVVMPAYNAEGTLKQTLSEIPMDIVDNVILVDDVFTSGATARACARQLKRAGAVEVRIFCWARVVPGRDALDLAYDASDMKDLKVR